MSQNFIEYLYNCTTRLLQVQQKRENECLSKHQQNFKRILRLIPEEALNTKIKDLIQNQEGDIYEILSKIDKLQEGKEIKKSPLKDDIYHSPPKKQRNVKPIKRKRKRANVNIKV